MIKTAAQILAELGDEEETGKRSPGRPPLHEGCRIELCTLPHEGLGLCSRHLYRFHTYGDPLGGKPLQVGQLKDRCPRCHGKVPLTGRNRAVAKEHTLKSGKVCPGSGRHAVRARCYARHPETGELCVKSVHKVNRREKLRTYHRNTLQEDSWRLKLWA